MVANADDAEDLLQDALLLGFRAFASYDPTRSFDNWMMAIIQNRARQLARKAKRVTVVGLDLLDERPDDEDAAESGFQDSVVEAQELAWAIEQLRPHQREAIRQIVAHGLDYHAIALALGVPVGTVRSRVFRTRESLKAILEEALR